MATCGRHFLYNGDCLACREADRHDDILRQNARQHREMLDRIDRDRRETGEGPKPDDGPSGIAIILGIIALAVALTAAVFVVGFALVLVPLAAVAVLILERVKPGLLPEALDKRVKGGFLRTPLVVAGVCAVTAIVLNAAGLPGIPLWFAALAGVGIWTWLRYRALKAG